MADAGSSQVPFAVSTQEKASKNKRKYLAEFPPDVQVDSSSSSLTEFPRYELLEEKIQNTSKEPGSLEQTSNEHGEEEEVESFEPINMDDHIVGQFAELLSHSLYATFQSAIKKIVECGYSEVAAEEAVLRTSLDLWSNDLVSNIVDGALVLLRREKESATSRHHLFQDLQSLVEFTVLEMTSILTEVKPSLTVAEAMWQLLIHDLNLSLASVEGESLNPFGGKEVPGESSSGNTPPQLKSEAQSSEPILSKSNEPYLSESSISSARNITSEIPMAGGIPNLPNLKNILVHKVTNPGKESLVSVPDLSGKTSGIIGENIHPMYRTFEDNTGGCRKGRTSISKRDMLRQKSLHLEKAYKGVSKGTVRGKLASWGSLVLDKKRKSSSHFSGVKVNSTSSKIGTAVGTCAPPVGNIHLNINPFVSSATCTSATPPKDTLSASARGQAKPSALSSLETKLIPKSKVSIPNSPKTPDDYYAGIPYDESLGKHIPCDEKDKTMLRLVPQLQLLQKEVQGWFDWANEKVKQAAQRLSKDQAELKILRREKEETEKLKKEKQILEENTMKRLSEMECALASATAQGEKANTTVCELEAENMVLKKEMETARLQALRSSASLQDAFLRQKEAVKHAQSWETEKSLLQEEFTANRCKLTELQEEIVRAKSLWRKTQAQHKQEEREKEKLVMVASSIRKEREQLEALAEEQEDMIRQKAEIELLRDKDDIKSIESKLSELRLKSESAKIAALRRGIGRSILSCQTDSKSYPVLQGYQAPQVPIRLSVTQDNFGAGNTRAERECVMCLTEEMTVVFLPCAHQVLCAECNQLHEEKGMNECPSCRTPIQWRINVRFASTSLLVFLPFYALMAACSCSRVLPFVSGTTLTTNKIPSALIAA